MTPANYISLAALAISVVMMLLNLRNSNRSARAKDEAYKEKQEQRVKNEVAEQTAIQIALDGIKDMLSDIKREMQNVKEDMKKNGDAIIRMQESLKSEHKRLDEHERQINAINEALRKRGE